MGVDVTAAADEDIELRLESGDDGGSEGGGCGGNGGGESTLCADICATSVGVLDAFIVASALLMSSYETALDNI